jgi:hypothetical protein
MFNDEQNDVAIIKIEDKKFKNLISLPYGIVTNRILGKRYLQLDTH